MFTRNVLRVSALVCAFTFFTVLMGMVLSPEPAEAVSQWARKYKTDCTTCHTVFPRLNTYGEQFMRAGYQLPGQEPDGDEHKQRFGEMTIDDVTNLLGFRLSLTPFKVETNKTDSAGESHDLMTIGDADWIQFFVAGSIYKNVSFFTEMAFDDEGPQTFHYSWWHVGFHNLLGTEKVNLTMGNISPIDFSAHSNRLRIFAPVKNDVYGIKTANGTGDDSVSISGSRPGIQYYGYGGPMIWWAGVSPGASAKDSNDGMYYWGGLRAEVTELTGSDLAGSSVSLWALTGEDVLGNAGTYTRSDTTRYQAAGNLRLGNLDVQAAYLWGDDDDGDLTTAVRDTFEFTGIALQGAWLEGNKWYPAISYDLVDREGAAAGADSSTHTITPALSVLLRANMRLGVYATMDLNDDVGHTKANTYQVNLRTMF